MLSDTFREMAEEAEKEMSLTEERKGFFDAISSGFTNLGEKIVGIVRDTPPPDVFVEQPKIDVHVEAPAAPDVIVEPPKVEVSFESPSTPQQMDLSEESLSTLAKMLGKMRLKKTKKIVRDEHGDISEVIETEEDI